MTVQSRIDRTIANLIRQGSLSTADTIRLQNLLHHAGYNSNFSKNGADGDLGKKTLTDVAAWARKREGREALGTEVRRGFGRYKLATEFASTSTNVPRAMHAFPRINPVPSHKQNIHNDANAKNDNVFMRAVMQAKKYSSRFLPSDPMKWNLVDKLAHTFRTAKQYGLDGLMLAVQIRQESGFKNTARSYVGALGIAQFMPGTGRRYGLRSREDFTNPQKAISAMAHHMSDLKIKHGSHGAALAAYNGGDGAVWDAKRALGKSEVTVRDLRSHWRQRAHRLGTRNRDAWHVQTYHYVGNIVDTTQAFAQALKREEVKMVNVPSEREGLGDTFDKAHMPRLLRFAKTHAASHEDAQPEHGMRFMPVAA
jgi:hypothetical protein